MKAQLKVIGVVGAALGCSGAADSLPQEWTATVDTLGDTVVVRTVSGSVWQDTATLVPELRIGMLEGPDEYMLGNVRSLAVSEHGEIYVMDSQVPALRKYDADGVHLATFGREGGGPGEYKNPDGGLAVLRDGRVVLRDPGNGRFNVYAPDGEYLDGWRLPGGGGFNTSRKLYTDNAGNVYTLVLLEVGLAPWDWTYGLGRYTPQGAHTDTLLVPVWDYQRPVVTGEREGSRSSTGVPFTPSPTWSFSPLGYFVGGLSTEFRIDLYRAADDHVRIEREWIPVPVHPDEASEQERRIRENFSRRFSGWRWNGPPIPEYKPPFRDIYVGDDGAIWVLLSRRGYAAVSAEDAREQERMSGWPVMRYRERVAFDVFDAEGRFLGHVRAPDAFSTDPDPIFRGDYVWAIERDELDVATIVRYRLALGSDTE